MGKKSPPPKPPDLTPISDAQLKIAEQSNDIAREQLGLSREQFAWFQENAREELALAREQADRLFEFQDRAFASDQEARDFARQVGQTQIDAMNQQMDYAQRDRQRWEDVFLPMQDQFIEEANAYDTPMRRDAEASRYMVDVQRQAEAQRANADAQLRAMGVDPSQVRSSSMANQMAVATGANQALAGNNARQMVEDRGRALRADAINMGNGLPAQAAMGYQGAGASGAGAVGAAAAGQGATLNAIQGGANVGGTALGFRSNALGNVAALTGSPMQWAQMSGNMMGQAMSGYGQAANTMNSGYQNQMQHWQAGQDQSNRNFSNIMSVAGMAAGMMMAEGGQVTKKAAHRAGVLPVNKADGAEALSGWDKIRARWAQRQAQNDPYVRAGAGSGEGGALSMADRFSNGVTAARGFMAEGGLASPGAMRMGRPPTSPAMPRSAPPMSRPAAAGGALPAPPTPALPAQRRFAPALPGGGSRGRAMQALTSAGQQAAAGGQLEQMRARWAQLRGGNAAFMAEGGQAGPLVMPRKQSRDKYPVLLADGEYVVPADVVEARGIEFFDKLVNKYHREGS